MASIDRALIAYDGSDAAKRAVAFASVLLPGAQAVIVHVFSSMPPWLALATPPVMAPPPADAQTDVSALERHGKEIADEGAALATASGLQGGPNTVSSSLPDGSSANSTIVTHPLGGPIFSGPQIQPWVCQAGATDPQCNQPTSYAPPARAALARDRA